MTVVQKADPYEPVTAALFVVKFPYFCHLCGEHFRLGDEIVPALKAERGAIYHRQVHYLCAVQSDDEYVSRDSRAHDPQGADE